MECLRVILGDQLSEQISALKDCDKANDLVLMCEVWDEATYVKHHKKKIAFLFSAMRHFAQSLRDSGYNVQYIELSEGDQNASFTSAVKAALSDNQYDKIVVTFPGEYRVLREIEGWQKRFSLPVEIRDDDRFLCQPEDFASWAEGRKQLRMEYFYREMRKKYSILMNGEEPIEGQWNFDADNRKSPDEGLVIPEPFIVEIDDITQRVLHLVAEKFSDHFGDVEPFYFAVTREQALEALSAFIRYRLKNFGDYQDAMIEGEPWMFHSHLSFYLNCGLLMPMECVQAAEDAYHKGLAPINAVEGFIRQIIGWREYVRGFYWLKMPEYIEENYFEASRDLPAFYWGAPTKMNCVRQCVLETKQNAYAHHIQRLMVLGNFALLAGISPAQVSEWFLIVYADAYEWVELPNVSGMSLFADGGELASKPYAGGGSYINKMSNYCKGCSYKVTKKNGPTACPFNYLYWNFLARNREKLEDNPRLGMMYRSYDRMSEDKVQAIAEDSRRFLDSLESWRLQRERV